MRVLCQIVVRNEADRYWPSWLDWHMGIFDAVHVYDDMSDDDTGWLAEQAGALVTHHNGGERFLEHEGKFRQRAWNAMESKLRPEPGDFIFALDADEMLVSHEDERDTLYRACEWANHQRRGAYMVSIPEIFKTDQQPDGELTNPQTRVDGWWGKIAGTRLFAWQPGGTFSNKQMGSGSEPLYVPNMPRSSLQGMWLLHYGYARPEDVAAKYARYNGTVHGHADSHVQSIVSEPVLVPWGGPQTNVYFGRRPQPGPEVPSPSV